MSTFVFYRRAEPVRELHFKYEGSQMPQFENLKIGALLTSLVILTCSCGSGKDGSSAYSSQSQQQQQHEQPATPNCPVSNCPTPPENCSYEVTLVNGCLSCGNLVCNPTLCNNLPICAAPPENCRYDFTSSPINDGCPIDCGELVCDQLI